MSDKFYNILRIKNLGLFVIIILGLILYLPMMPQTVQMFDTGELVTNSYLLRVIHPPGYPLFTWLYFFFTHLIPGKNIFWLASLLTVITSLGTLGIIYKYICSLSKEFWSICLIVMSSGLFWRYGLLPDVFMLHAFITSLVLYLYLRGDKYHRFLFLIWGISTSHHHTTVFLLPILLHSLFAENKKELIKYLIYGLVISLFLYLSLLLMNTSQLTSWGNLDDFNALIRHILRSDYGTFKLTASTQSLSVLDNLVEKLIFYIKESAAFLLPLLCICIYALIVDAKKLFNDKKLQVLSLTYFVYILVFFSLSNIELSIAGKEVFSRFMIMPNIIFVFITMRLIGKISANKIRSTIIMLSTIIVCTYNLFTHYKTNDFSGNTVMSDWAYNKLSATSENDIVIEKNDSSLFSLYYLQEIKKYKPQVRLLSPRLLFHEWYFDKISKINKRLKLDKNKVINLKKYDVYKDLILPNINDYSFLTSEYNVLRHPKLSVEYTLSGSKLHIKSNADIFTEKALRRLESSYFSLEDGFMLEKQVLFGPCIYYMLNIYANKNLDNPIKALMTALDYVPFCYQAANELCRRKYQPAKYCEIAKKNKKYEFLIKEDSFY